MAGLAPAMTQRAGPHPWLRLDEQRVDGLEAVARWVILYAPWHANEVSPFARLTYVQQSRDSDLDGWKTRAEISIVFLL
jgi:hypothetical protein